MNEDDLDGEMNVTYRVKDVAGFCKGTRQLVVDDLHGSIGYTGKLTDKDLDEFITLAQIENIIRENQLTTDDDESIYLNMIVYENIVETITYQVYGAALSKLAASGFLECAWDEKLNDMVFWVSDK